MQQTQTNPGQNFLAGLTGGLQAGGQIRQMQDQNALAGFMKQNGAALAQGDQTAINGYAAFDPQGAFNMRRQGQSDARAMEQQQYQRERNQNTDLRAEESFRQQTTLFDAKMKEAAAQMNANERAAAAAQFRQGLMPAVVSHRQGPDAFNAFVMQNQGEVAQTLEAMGLSISQLTYENAPQVFARIDGAAKMFEAADSILPEEPKPLTDAGKAGLDARNGFIDLDIPQVDFETEQKLRKEFLGIPQVKAFSEQSQAYERIVNSARDPSPAGDLALIFNFMKVLDPGSVVRESEFETAAQATAWLQNSEELGINVPQPISSAIRKMASGQRLAPEQRQDFLGRAESLYDGAERGFMNLKTQYEGKAKAYNLDPERSLADFRRVDDPAATIAAPAGGGVPDVSQMSDEELQKLIDGGGQ